MLSLAEVGTNERVFVGDEEVGDFPRQARDERDKLEDPASVHADNFGGLGVGVDRFILEQLEPLQALKNRVVSVGDPLVMLPLPNRNPEDLDQSCRFPAACKDGPRFTSSCAARQEVPNGSWFCCCKERVVRACTVLERASAVFFQVY